jgi:ADP-L-glycero-D-manno-heptose 6-epimerase
MSAEILVTGAAGFIGSAVVRGLNELGREDILLADFLGHDDKWRNLVPLAFEDYLEGDSLMAGLYTGDSRLEAIRYIFHLGANSNTTERDVRHLIENNFETTKRLAAWSLERGARFVYASSAATYGDGSRGMEDTMQDLEALRPLNAYGYSKQLFDLYAKRQGWLEHLVGLKYFNVFGPNEGHKGDMRSLVHKAFHQVRDQGFIELFRSHHPDFEDGKQKRDFLYIKDAVAMTLHLGFATQASGLYNLGSGVASTWIELTEAIFEALGKPVDIRFIDMPEHLRGKYQYYTCSCIDKLRSSGFAQPITPLKTAVDDYVSHYLLPDRRLGE